LRGFERPHSIRTAKDDLALVPNHNNSAGKQMIVDGLMDKLIDGREAALSVDKSAADSQRRQQYANSTGATHRGKTSSWFVWDSGNTRLTA
jgi:hypothetical protein